MRLFRSIGELEFKALLLDGHIHGRFDCSKEGQTSSNLTHCLCTFTEPYRWDDAAHELFITLEVGKNLIKGKGKGTYYAAKSFGDTKVWTGRRGSVEYILDEVYLSQYSLEDVVSIEGIKSKYANHYIYDTIMPVLGLHNIEIK